MIPLKNKLQIEEMKKAGRITAEAMAAAIEAIREGVSTWEIDRIVRHRIERCGARPTFLGYGGFPGSACISINDEVIHGIPSRSKILHNGDIVKLDLGAFYHGFTGDMARTVAVGSVSADAARLITAARESFEAGAAAFREGGRIGDIGSAIQTRAESDGFSVVRRYIGHGVGRELHEDPEVPNYGTPGRGVRLQVGMTLAIEPMINMGRPEVYELDDGWTVKTVDGSLSAHYENSVALTEDGILILTALDA
ncbi:MAG: type I methionyl aminopeptidase [Clostridia bacterium]|nr:type I methionyl aminopeptidase [Clostridia bacterium]MBP5269691.1 type I methionyl aminopeptidase [Clostridia bacterium]